MLQSWVPWTLGQFNAPSWALSTEAFFYLLFPFIISSLTMILVIDLIPPELLNNGILAPLYAGIFYVLAEGRGCLSKILKFPILLMLGEASYAIYLFQAPVRSWIEIGFKKFLDINFESPSVVIYFIVLLIFSLWISNIDLRFQKLLKRYK